MIACQITRNFAPNFAPPYKVALIMSSASVADKVLIAGLAKTVVGRTVKTIREIEKNGCDRLITSEQINDLLDKSN